MSFFLEKPLRPLPTVTYRPFSPLMVLHREIKASQISALSHTVPDTPFRKQIFFFFWLKEHINMPSEMDRLSLFSFIFSSLTSVSSQEVQ